MKNVKMDSMGSIKGNLNRKRLWNDDWEVWHPTNLLSYVTTIYNWCIYTIFSADLYLIGTSYFYCIR